MKMLVRRGMRKWLGLLGALLVCGVGLRIAIAFIFNPVGQNTNVDNVLPVITPSIQAGRGLFLLILVTSSPGNFQARLSIRKTWGHAARTARFRVVFMLGSTSEPEISAKLKAEILQYGDLLVGSFADSYTNLPLKSLMSLSWALNNAEARYVVKTDDDMYIHTTRLVDWLDRVTLPKLYAGRVRLKAQVNRFRFHRYSVSYENYPEKFYPPYCYGVFYILSRNALKEILNASHKYSPFPAEDAYLGVLASEIGLTPVELSSRIFLIKSNYWTEIDVNCIGDDFLANAMAIGDSLKPQLIEYVHSKVAVLSQRSVSFPCEPYKTSGRAKLIFALLLIVLFAMAVTCVLYCKQKYARSSLNKKLYLN